MPINPMRSTGVNYEPGEVDLSTTSTGHLDFEVDAIVGNHPITLRGFEGIDDVEVMQRACAAGTTHCIASRFEVDESSPGDLVADLLIGRFAEVGRLLDSPFGPFTWLVTLENGSNLRGSLRVPADRNGADPAFPGEITLAGRMVIVIQLDGAEPVTLRSRRDARQQGTADGWPPYGTTLTMCDGPVEYFDERELTDPDAQPFMRTEAARIEIMSECRYLSTVPTIVDVTPIGEDGLVWHGGRVRAARVEWEEREDLVEEDGHEVVFGSYRIYRRLAGSSSEGWELIGSVPWQQSFFIDTEFDGTVDVEYVVARGVTMPFDYVFEGLFGPPMGVAPVAA
jgi:hypothetical protein